MGVAIASYSCVWLPWVLQRRSVIFDGHDVNLQVTCLCTSRRHAWVASVLDGDEWLASRSRHFAARVTATDTRTRRVSVCGRASLEGLEKTKLLPVAAFGCPARGLVTTTTQTTLCSASMAVIYIQMQSFCKTYMQNYSSTITPIFKPVCLKLCLRV